MVRQPMLFCLSWVLKNYIDSHKIEQAAVIGGGFIGVEVAENLALAGISVSLVEGAPQIMAPFDYDVVQTLHKEMMDNGISLYLSSTLTEVQEDRILIRSREKTQEIKADLVVMAIGVRPETALASAAGLTIGATGGIWVNHNYQTSDPDIYAVGDAIESFNRILRQPGRLALAGPAQKQARGRLTIFTAKPMKIPDLSALPASAFSARMRPAPVLMSGLPKLPVFPATLPMCILQIRLA